MVDIIITTYNRVSLLKQTMDALFTTVNIPHRIFVIDDCSPDGTAEYLTKLQGDKLHFVVLSKKRNGIVYGFNTLWNMVEYFDSYYEQNPYLCYLQDDMVATDPKWLQTLIRVYEDLRDKHNIGFFGGYDAPEHPVREYMQWNGIPVVLKASSSATNLIAEKSFWQSIGYVPRCIPDGTERGFPGKGKGSHIDLYLTGCMSRSQFVPHASAKNSLFLQGKNFMAVPGLLNHEGYAETHSTWRNEKPIKIQPASAMHSPWHGNASVRP